MELVQQEPFSIGVELAGCCGSYTTTCVAGFWTASLAVVEDDDEDEGFTVDDPEKEKNCAKPNASTSTITMATIILLVRCMMIGNFICAICNHDDVKNYWNLNVPIIFCISVAIFASSNGCKLYDVG